MLNVLQNIENIIKKLSIEPYYQVADGESNEYIIFDIFSEKDTEFAEDENMTITYYVTLNYWHKGKQCFTKYKTIKEAFKSEGFFFDDMRTLKSSKQDVYGKNYTFKYEEVI